MAAKTVDYVGIPARRMKPTKKHRPAIWEGMLGTVYAMNEAGETKYFDYDWDDAKAHAGIPDKTDIRLYRHREHIRYSNGADIMSDPQMGKLVLWVERIVK